MKNRKWIILGLGIIFIILTILVKTNAIEAFDNYFYDLIAYKQYDSKTLFYKIITFLGSTEFIVSLCVIFLVVFTVLKKRNYGLIITGVLIISTIVNNLIKVFLMRERPDVISFVNEHSYSFPSGHTMAAVSMYGILLYLILKSNWHKGFKIAFIIIFSLIPVLVAMSRVYLGAHFMSDVIGAFLVSIILLIVETYYIDKKNWI